MNYTNDAVDVFFVDYGNLNRVSRLTEVKPIANMQLTELQTLALPCSLRGIAGKKWTENEIDDLHRMLDNGKFTVSKYLQDYYYC